MRCYAMRQIVRRFDAMRSKIIRSDTNLNDAILNCFYSKYTSAAITNQFGTIYVLTVFYT